MLLGIFGFPFADVACDAFLTRRLPCPLSAWCAQSLVSSGSGPAPAAVLSVSHQTPPSPAAHPAPSSETQDITKFSQQKLDLIAPDNSVIKGKSKLNIVTRFTADRCVFMEMNVTCLKTSYLESKFLCCYFYYDSNARTDTAGIDREWVERGAERGKRDRITVTQSLKIGDTLELIRWCDKLLNLSAQCLRSVVDFFPVKLPRKKSIFIFFPSE